jgi:hypothetical protein
MKAYMATAGWVFTSPRLAVARAVQEIPSVRALRVSLSLLVAFACGARAQGGPDSTLTVHGFLQQDAALDLWTIVVPTRLEAFGARTYVLPLVGKPGRWERYLDHYVEATGRVAPLTPPANPPIGLDVAKMREVEAPGTVRTVIERAGMRATLTVVVIPNRFAWKDSAGRETGVNPLVMYTIANEHVGPIIFYLPTNDLFCVTVRSPDAGGEWDSIIKVPPGSQRRFTVQRGGLFREIMQLPPDAAPRRGRYLAQGAICSVSEYEIAAPFEVH